MYICAVNAVLLQYGIAVLVSLSGLTAGAWLTWPSTASKLLLRGDVCCTASRGQVTTMVALMDFGNILTPIPASYLCNIYGRKPVIHLTAAMFIAASVLVMVASDMWYLYLARLLAGMGKGVAFAVTPLFLAEISQVRIRGALGAIFSAALSVGISYDYIFGSFLSYQGLNIANIVIPITFGVGYFFVPESPYYLAMKGNEKKAIKSLSIYRQLSVDNEELKTEMNEIQTTVDRDMKNTARFIDVVTTKSRRRALLITSMTAFFQRFAGISPLLAYSTIMLPETGGGWSIEIYVIIFSFLIVIGNYIGIALVDKLGRKILFAVSTAGCAISDAIFAVFFAFKFSGTDITSYYWIPYANLLFFGFIWGLGMSYIPTILVSELFPTNIKSYASCIQTIMFAVASFIANELFAVSDYAPEIMFFLFSGGCVVCLVLTWLYIFETKGKTFQEIQDTLMYLTGEIEPRSDEKYIRNN